MKFDSHISRFRTIAIFEGVSYLLLGFTMILKYAANMPLPNKIVGYAHGFLFIAYIIWLYVAAEERKWVLKIIFLLFVASLVPFGTFIADKLLIKREEERSLNQL